MKFYSVIVAGGKGLRMGNKIPKQFIEVNGIPILIHTINSFLKYDRSINIIIGIPKDQLETWELICKKYNFNHPHSYIIGGNTRFDTVKNCLKTITEESIIAVHDGVRPFVDTETIQSCYNMALKKGTAVPVIPLNESIRLVRKEENVSVNREEYQIVQTPQIFRSEIILEAYKTSYKKTFTDDASVVEAAGYKINLVKGNKNNIKITSPSDLLIAEKILSGKININN